MTESLSQYELRVQELEKELEAAQQNQDMFGNGGLGMSMHYNQDNTYAQNYEDESAEIERKQSENFGQYQDEANPIEDDKSEDFQENFLDRQFGLQGNSPR